MVRTERLTVGTRGQDHIVDLTEAVGKLVQGDGVLSLFVLGSTAALTVIEFEQGMVYKDFPAALERMASVDGRYEHEADGHDDNGHSHIRASLIGPSLTVPVIGGKLLLGVWQAIVLVECDTRPREREVVVQMIS